MKVSKKNCKKKGYSVTVKAVEIGARGFVAGTLYQFLEQIGINRRNRIKSMKRFIFCKDLQESIWPLVFFWGGGGEGCGLALNYIF